MAILLLPAALALRADAPLAVLLLPILLELRAAAPVAALLLPVVFEKRAEAPLAVLLPPVLLALSAEAPLAVLLLPVVLAPRAANPVAVFSDPSVLLCSANATSDSRLHRIAWQPCKSRVVPHHAQRCSRLSHIAGSIPAPAFLLRAVVVDNSVDIQRSGSIDSLSPESSPVRDFVHVARLPPAPFPPPPPHYTRSWWTTP